MRQREDLPLDPTWASYQIASTLSYTASLWYFCCGILHGHTQEESAKITTQHLHQQITQAYHDYSTDPSTIPSQLRSLFTSHPLDERVKQSPDTLVSWLRTVSEVKQAQQRSQQHLATTAKKFFSHVVRPPPFNWSISVGSLRPRVSYAQT